MKLQVGKETDFNIIGRDGHTGYTNNSRSVQLVCLYLFEYQDAYQMNTNIRIIRIYSNNGIRMRPLLNKHNFCSYTYTSTLTVGVGTQV